MVIIKNCGHNDVKFGQFGQFGQIWANLGKFGQIWVNLVQYEILTKIYDSHLCQDTELHLANFQAKGANTSQFD